MITKLSRFFILIIIILVTAVYFPEYYWISFEEKGPSPMAYYSPILKDYLIAHFKKGFFYKTRDGRKYNREQADILLPLFNYRILTAKGKMPDSIQGRKIDLAEVRKNNFFIRIRPDYINVAMIPLYPLMESNPPRFNLSVPEDFFRITEHGIEFIEASTNKILVDKSKLFTQAMQKQGFVFPAKNVFGNITTRKPFDEGYFIIDSADQLFHLKMINGKPFCRNTHKPDSIDVRTIFINERDLKEFYGIVLDRNNHVYFLMYDQYRFQKTPIKGYDADVDNLYIMGNLFYRIFNVKKNTQLLSFTTDRNYKLIDSYEENWPGFYQTAAGKISKYIFPFTLQVRKSTTEFINYYFDDFSFKALFLNVILVIISLIIIKRRKTSVTQSWMDIALVLFTGIYGFVGILLIEAPID